jgi:hypothetical protein
MLTPMRLMRVGMAVALICALMGEAAAQQMFLDTRQGRTGTDWNECMARAKRALQAESWAIGGEYGAAVRGAHLVAWKGGHGVILACDVEPNGAAFWTMTMSGLAEGNHPLMDALGRQLGSPSNTPRPPPPAQKSCWDWYGEFLDGRVAVRDAVVTLTSDGSMQASWGWKGQWRTDGSGGYRLSWEGRRAPDQDDVMRMAPDGRTMEGRNFEARFIRGTQRACP